MPKKSFEGDQSRPARVRYFEIEGSDETIQKALATFERLRSPNVAPPPPQQLRAAAPSSPQPGLFDGEETVDGEEVTNAAESVQSSPVDRRRRGEGVSVDRNAAIVAVGDIDFYPAGKQSLKDFYAQKAPPTDKERALTFCYYLQETLAVSPYGAGHVLACFNNVYAGIPKDLPGTLRNIREGKKGSEAWLAFDDLNGIRVTTNGLNYVRHELGKPGTQKDSKA